MSYLIEKEIQFKEPIEREGIEKINSVSKYLSELKIEHEIYYHPPLPTIEKVKEFWDTMHGVHCKNLFFRNHKGNRHYLVIFDCNKELDIRSLELKLKQGKLTFASAARMEKYLGLTPGSVSPFGLISDQYREVKLFIDSSLSNSEYISFHPKDNRASLVLRYLDFIKFLDERGNQYEYI